MNQVVEITEERFESEVLKSELPVMVDVYAPWCGPCKMLTPVVEQLATEFTGKVKVAKLDVDEAPGIAGQFQITGVPTLLFFRNGRLMERVVGFAPPNRLRTSIQQLTANTVLP